MVIDEELARARDRIFLCMTKCFVWYDIWKWYLFARSELPWKMTYITPKIDERVGCCAS
jgi:hypothetical protein